jgi:hypothetical protein
MTEEQEKLMSIDFRPLTPIRMSDLFDGRLASAGVYEHRVKAEHDVKLRNPNARCLTDGKNFLWVFSNEEGFVSSFTRWMPNGDPQYILSVIVDDFEVEIVSEYEPQYWGFDTEEEWDAFMEKMSQKDEFHIELLKYLRGEPNDIRPGTIGMCQAEIAKTLVEKDPSLLQSVNKDKLRNEIQSIYDRDHRSGSHLIDSKSL